MKHKREQTTSKLVDNIIREAELKKAQAEKENIDKDVAEIAQQVQDLRKEIEEKERTKDKPKKGKKGKPEKKEMPNREVLTDSFIERANNPEVVPKKDNFATDHSKSTSGSGCCSLL